MNPQAKIQPEQMARWLSVKQAAAYCPYGQKKLIQLIKDQTIKGGKLADNNNMWFVDRLSLDEHLHRQCLSPDAEKKVVDYIRGLN